VILDFDRARIEQKDGFNTVVSSSIRIEKKLVAQLEEILPGSGFLC